ncbi:hypothetical protein F5H01DRAFT_284985 [Linnemannia elongata]|uniref:INO80 complex subunit B-like conserved region domain-containing protein n=1 Tax=Linnemannia elongata AG-77 TaxID=1314771 RepID=A0A197K2N9_9FUNG|nr:hypothetical protein F5H01DRAFT_284985 [Linnemannia elongata]OAQ31458.1 hypothetical protein K457DRAFT_71775 [Linnemannia elongata AG-77]
MGFGGQLTKRQRSKLDVHDVSLELFELPVAQSRKRMQTEEEMALKRSEITRRRKNQSAQRAEQDKLETINRLLKKQAGKRKTGAQDDDEGGAGGAGDDKRVEDIKGGRRSNRAIEVLEVPVVPLKEPAYPAPRGLCAVANCEQAWKYRGTKSKKVACGLAHLKVVEAEA